MTSMIILGYVAAGLFGLVFGSFAGATVWRLRARELVANKKAGESIDKAEAKRLSPLSERSMRSDRSQCLECGHTLAWYDLVPLMSWVSTRGKCRYCNKRIGLFEPAMEVGMAFVFVTVFHAWVSAGLTTEPYLLVSWLIVAVMLGILFVYDAKWYILPDAIIFPLIGLAGVLLVPMLLGSEEPLMRALSTLGAVAILSGIYLVLWLVSKGAWIGFGDVKLGLALGLLLADWQLAFLALFLANLIGTLIVVPGLLTKKMSRGTHVPFGPLLIVGFAISASFGPWLIELYQQLTISVMFAVALML